MRAPTSNSIPILFRNHLRNILNAYSPLHLNLGFPKSEEDFSSEMGGVVHRDSHNLSTRADVVKKTIFRSFKQYLRNTFKLHYNFTNIKRGSETASSSTVFSKANEFITKNYATTNSERVGMFLVAIVDTKKKFAHDDPAFSEVRDQVHEALKNFRKDKITKLLTFPEI